VLTKELFNVIRSHYAQSYGGTHGLSHWARVLENGRLLSSKTNANLHVVELFAVFHDSGRISEKRDPDHGQRGADLAKKLRGKHFDLPDHDFNLLYDACVRHTDGETDADITVQVCWDSDRLDLGRVNIIPSPDKLCTKAARDPEVIAWALERSKVRFEPELMKIEWGLNGSGTIHGLALPSKI
jgi:uncharacterized protein